MPDSSSHGIFLSYRREDAGPYARSLQRKFGERFPDERVFMDLDSSKAGLDFAEVIKQAVGSCAVLVALIGPRWATLPDEQGNRRLDNPNDSVRLEVQAALGRGVRVIPVLVDGAMPLRGQELPAELQKLARLNALELSSSRHHYDADRLLDLIQQVLTAVGEPEEAERKAPAEAERPEQREAERPKPVFNIRGQFDHCVSNVDGDQIWGAEPEAREQAERKARSEAERRARSEAERQAREQAEAKEAPPRTGRRARKQAEREAREWDERLRREAEAEYVPEAEEKYFAPAEPPLLSLPVSYDDLVRTALAELVQPGRLLFNPPDRMQLGQTERVEVRLTRTLALDAELLKNLRGHGEPQLEEIPTAPLMAVMLKGDGFRITAYSDEEQSVTQSEITTWEFDIRALKRGQQRLIMSVSLRIPVPGQPSEHKSVPVREATIDVTVGGPALIGHFVTSNWQWFIGTAIAIAAVLVAVLSH